jgi:hypothetical protein
MLNIQQLAEIYHAKHNRSTRIAKAILGGFLGYPKKIGAKAGELDAVLEEIENHTQRAEIMRIVQSLSDGASEAKRDNELFIGQWRSKTLKHDFVEQLVKRFSLDDVRFILETITKFER